MKTKKNGDGSMGLNEHLGELRKRIIAVALVFVISLVCFVQVAQPLVDYYIEQASAVGYEFVYLSPSELFMQYIRVAVIGAVVVIVPFIMYQVWAFVRPGLKKSENFAVFVAMIMGLCCFAGGAYFAHRVIIPFMLVFYRSINTSDLITASISVENYVGFLASNYMIFGTVFELPVVVTLLTEMGIVHYPFLLKARKIVIVLIFVMAAIITPPDVVSQCLCALPMILLFEISLQLCRLIDWRKSLKQED